MCNRAESRRWHDLNAPPCAASGSAVAPPASRNQWGQWANCGSVRSRWQKNGPSSYTAARSATYKWVSPSALVAQYRRAREPFFCERGCVSREMGVSANMLFSDPKWYCLSDDKEKKLRSANIGSWWPLRSPHHGRFGGQQDQLETTNLVKRGVQRRATFSAVTGAKAGRRLKQSAVYHRESNKKTGALINACEQFKVAS